MTQNPRNDIANDCETLLDLIPEYAFGLIDSEQTRLVENGLANCPEAVVQLEEYRNLQEDMRAAVPQIEPSAQLGARLMAAIAAPASSTATAPTPVSASLPTLAELSVPALKSRRTLRVARWIAAAAVLALVATNVYWLTRIADLTQSHDLLTALVNAQSSSAFVLTSTDALHWVRLSDPQSEGNTAAFMMWNSQSKIGLLYARSFPDLQPGYKYHVWLTRPNARVFMGILQVDANGDGALLFTSPEPINNFSWAWVTAENGTETVPPAQIPAVVKGELNPT